MKHWFAVLVCSVLCVSACSALAAETSAGPKISAASLDFHFGTVAEGAVVAHDFNIENRGEGDLVLERIVPICGCTAVSTAGQTVAPGAATQLHLEFNTLGFVGDQEKLIRVYSNEIGRRFVTFTVRGTVIPELLAEPEIIQFGTIARGIAVKRQIVLTIPEGSKASISEVKLYGANMTMTELEASAANRKVELEMPADAAYGEIRGRLIVKLSGGIRPTINIPIVGQVVHELKLRPAIVSFGLVTGTEEVLRREVQLVNRTSNIVEIEEAVSSDEAVSAQILPNQDGIKTIVEVVLDPAKLQGSLKASLTIKTNLLTGGQLVLPIRAVTRPILDEVASH